MCQLLLISMKSTLYEDLQFSLNELNKRANEEATRNSKYPAWIPAEAKKMNFNSSGVDDEFLFFLFYYTVDSTQLYAAHLLKQRNWKFHKNLKQWMKVINQPTYSSGTVEYGNYHCFDYTQWCLTTKIHFCFEHSAMEL